MPKNKRQEYGEGSVYQRQSDQKWVGTIEAGWNEKGKRRRVTVTGPTEAAVRRKLRDKKAEIAKAAGRITDATAARMTIKAWSTEWLAARITRVRPSTYTADQGAVSNWIVPTIGTKRIVDVTPRDIRAVVSKQRAAGGKPASLLRTHRRIIKMLRDASEEGYAVQPGVFAMKAPSEGETDREAMTTAQALAILHHAADLPHGSRYLVGFYQGWRQGEILGLTWDALDLDAGMATIEWQLQPLPYLDKKDHSRGFRIPDGYTVRHLEGRFHLVRPKTRKGLRTVPLAPTAVAALRKWREECPPNPHGLVWARPNGWPIDKAHDAAEFRKLQEAANVRHPSGRPYVGHEMRNTTATLLLESGADPVTITAILGHSSWAVSAGYMVARQGPQLAAMKAVEAAFTVKEIGH